MAATIPFGPGPADERGFNRTLLWSFAVHVSVVLFFVLAPRDWLVKKREPEHLMTISLGGTVGPRTTGTTAIGGRTVEQVAPPPKREVPVRPAPKDEAPPAPVKTPPPVEKNVTTPKPAPPATRPPVTGQQVTQGNTPVDTGVKGSGAGLTSGGGGGAAAETDIKDFCCPGYLQQIVGTVQSHWNKNQPDRGVTTMKFTVLRSGAITDITLEQSSGSGLLDRAAKAALLDSAKQLAPLPAEFTQDTLIIHLKFPFNGTQ